LLHDLVRFRATQLNEWQSDLPQIRAGERFSPGRGMSRVRGAAL
jgi:hypothetical protein